MYLLECRLCCFELAIGKSWWKELVVSCALEPASVSGSVGMDVVVSRAHG